MDQIDVYLLYQKEVAEAKLKIIQRLQQHEQCKPEKRTSNIEIVKNILATAGQPLHVSQIIQVAKQQHNINLDRDSIVSALLKKVNAGQSFVRTAPNTFALTQAKEEP